MSQPPDPANLPSFDIDFNDADGVVDRTVRPVRPELRQHLEAEREKIRQFSGSVEDLWDIITIDGPADTTVRPARPELRKHLEAEREKIRRCQEERQAREKPPDADKSAN